MNATIVEEIDHRPSVVALIGLLAGLAAGTAWWRGIFGVLALVLLSRWRSRAVLAVAFGIGLGIVPRFDPPLTEPTWIAGTGVISGMPRLLVSGSRFTVQTTGAAYDVVSPGNTTVFALGDVVELQGLAKPPPEESRDYHALNGLAGRVSTREVRLVRRSDWPLMNAGLQFRNTFLRWSDSAFRPDTARLLQAMTVGTDSRLSERQYELLRRSGTIHMVSASGFQVGVFAAAVGLLLTALPIPRIAQWGALALILVTYAFAAGFNAPILRAVIMALVPSLAYAIRRSPDTLSAWAIAGLGLVLAEPRTAFQPGAQLSFFTVLAMIWWTEQSDSALATNLRTNAVATIASMPLLIVHFGQINPVGFFANLLVAFPASSAVITGLLGYAVESVLGATMAAPFVWVTAGLLGWCDLLMEWCAATPISVIDVPPIWPEWMVAAGLMAMALRPVRRRDA
ncbi:MAG: ComEC/Rec2 family competence protein [Fimbriimonadaceae bacterium]|nr:ComEC/Rec2 family competence protein [Fimbriimonadaceae bacterium]